jgi:hypothetical protein
MVAVMENVADGGTTPPFCVPFFRVGKSKVPLLFSVSVLVPSDTETDCPLESPVTVRQGATP